MGAVRKALSLGCAKGVLVTDDTLRGSDVLVTATVLAKAIEGAGFDLLLAGVESTDGSTGTLPMALAELLGVPSLTFARKVEVADGSVTIERQTEAGFDVVECPLPALVTVTAGATEPRYPTLKGIMQAKQKPVDQLTLSELGLSAEDTKPTQQVTGIEDAPERGAGEIVENEGEGAARIAEFLQEAKVI
jgi:electron transfer flavoprotein beta subunit